MTDQPTQLAFDFVEPMPLLNQQVPVKQRARLFAQQLPYRARPYAKRNWGHPLHSLCSYQGKLKPAIAHFLVKIFTRPGERVLDPFSGVGTIPFEAGLQGRVGIGGDINPIAYHSTLAKVRRVDADRVEQILNELVEFLNDYVLPPRVAESVQISVNRPIQEYYHPDTFIEILKAREFFRQWAHEHSPEISFVMACLLHILHGNRPYALSRRSHGITPFAPTGPFVYKSLMTSLRDKVRRMLAEPLPDTFVEGDAHHASIFDLALDKRVDVIITSPPFIQSTRFYSSNWIRLWFCGWDWEDQVAMKDQFLEEKQRKDIGIYADVLRAFDRLIKPAGLCIMHLGATRGRRMGEEILPYVSVNGFEFIGLESENVEDCESHGVCDQGSTVRHQFLFLRRRASRDTGSGLYLPQ